jgi:hypothetical protein
LKNWLTRGAMALALSLGLGACNADQMRAWFDMHGVDHSTLTEEEVIAWAEVSTLWWDYLREAWEAAAAAPAPEVGFVDKFAHVLSGDQLYRLRACESGDNYNAISSSGAYRGAYQFSRSTWNAVASRHYPEFGGQDPAWAEPHVQDAMARALWSMQGRSPWPHCGYRV